MTVSEIADSSGISRQYVNRIILEAPKQPDCPVGRRRPVAIRFVVPDAIDVIEQYGPGANVFTDKPIPNDKLEQLRAELRRDDDIVVKRVASFRPDLDDRQHVVVWVFAVWDETANRNSNASVTRAFSIVLPGHVVDEQQSDL